MRLTLCLILSIFVLSLHAPSYGQEDEIAQDELDSLEQELEALESGMDSPEDVESAADIADDVPAVEEDDFSAEEDIEADEFDELEQEMAEEEALDEEALDEEFAEEELAEEEVPEPETLEGEEEFPEEEVAEEDDFEEVGEDEEFGEEDLAEEDLVDDIPEEEVPPPSDFADESESEFEETADSEEEVPDSEPLFEETDETEEQFVQEPEPVPDVPDLDLEKSLQRAYSRLRKDPLSSEEWAEIAGERLQEQYDIQAGDTLWDVSVVLFGSGYFWPKLWQLNKEITNPHLIQPGLVLTFTDGSLEEAPEISTEEEVQEVIPPVAEIEEPIQELAVVEEEVIEEEEEYPEPEIPDLPPARKSRPLLTMIPPSLGTWHKAPSADQFDTKFGRLKTGKILTNQYIPISSYFTEVKPEFLGKVVEIETGFEVAYPFQYIFVQLEEGGVGDQFTVFKIKDPVMNEFDNVIGYPVETQGAIRITETVNADRNIYKAVVESAIFPLEVKSLLRKGNIEKVRYSGKGRPKDVSATIVGGQFAEKRQILGLGSILFLDAGEGLNAGDILRVYQSQKVRNPGSMVQNNTKVIGKIQVVKVVDNRSTAVVVDLINEIIPGDFTGNIAKIGIDVEDADEFLEFEEEDSASFEEEDDLASAEDALDEEILEDIEEAEQIEDETSDEFFGEESEETEEF